MVSSAWPGVARASANAAALTVKTARLSSILISIPPNDFDGRLDPDDSVAGSLAYRPPPAASEFLSRAPHALGGYRDRRWNRWPRRRNVRYARRLRAETKTRARDQ